MKVRDDVLKSREEARTEKIIGNSLEAKVTIEANDEDVKEVLSNIKDIHQLLIVSEAVINETHPDAKEYKYTNVHVENIQAINVIVAGHFQNQLAHTKSTRTYVHVVTIS